MYRGKKLISVCFFVLLLSACGTTTLSTASSPRPVPTLQKPALTPSSTNPMSSPTPVLSNPAHLLIPSISVDAPVENIGVLPDGDLATPTQNPWDGVGWYHLGPHPGQRGSAVIAGHLDRPGGAPAVFWNLRNMQPGDIVTVVDEKGASLHFRVTQVASYPPDQAPLQEIFANAGGRFLNLITCAGDWIPSEHQTTLRLVVYTSLI
ncbi:MAG: class F sortase [Ktedonobacteraceae bacterium]|nr:class F sortase [Ktedonobacteraceae bacterium]